MSRRSIAAIVAPTWQRAQFGDGFERAADTAERSVLLVRPGQQQQVADVERCRIRGGFNTVDRDSDGGCVSGIPCKPIGRHGPDSEHRDNDGCSAERHRSSGARRPLSLGCAHIEIVSALRVRAGPGHGDAGEQPEHGIEFGDREQQLLLDGVGNHGRSETGVECASPACQPERARNDRCEQRDIHD